MFEAYDDSRRLNPEAFPPLVILLDINMPVMGGFEFLEAYHQLRKKRSELELSSIIVMLTSSAEYEDKKLSHSFAAVKDYVVKPLSVERATELADTFGVK